ncbi:uncharacterized protein mslnb isoform X9 [Anguilla anguilla]|uniref:uncharacterized protein mslnb isoform X9 n=1 Tax=Anguilla anguilla TaxID=7936 RepID=UPI0015A895F8|nr:uncharacterized protein mslnb isoform X9 [Anguilla anguilla]
MWPHFLLIYIGAIGFGCFNKYVSSQCLPMYPNGTECSDTNSTNNGHGTAGMCNSTVTQSGCFPSTTSTVRSFLQCVGLPVIMSENSVDHMKNLKGVIDTALGVYSFMRSSFSQGPILELAGGIGVNTEAEQFHDLDFVKLWFQVKLKPLLSTVTRKFLSCLSSKNFSCETYQAVVKELSLHFSNMDPVRQRWIYMFFMYPFLARNGTAGCVAHLENSEDWLMKNFGSFSAMAHFKDFTALNIVFSGLEVLHLLTPEQKAELILHPEVGGLDNGTINLVFESLIKPLQESQHMNASRPLYNMTTSAPILHGSTPGPSHPMPSQHNGLQTALNGFLVFFKPLGSFVKEFVSLTHQPNLTSLKSTTLAQAMINWTLAELAGHFTENGTVENEIKPTQSSSFGNFDITDIDDWFQQVVVPVLKRFLPDSQTEIPMDLTAVFYNLFSLTSNLNAGESDAPDECSVTIEEHSCSIPSAVENLAYVLRCVSHTNLTLTEENMRVLVIELSQMLNSLVGQYSTLNFSAAESHFMDLFGKLQTGSFTDENLHDAEYIGLWFQIKLKPLLPSVSKDFLFCLSNKNFSCETFQVLVMELSDHISLMDEMKQQLIYTHFIHPFLLRHKYSDSSCISSTSSLEWVIENFGKFSVFAPLQHFFDLHSNFSALEALPALSAKQMAELVASPESGPPQKNVVINTVFDHLLELPKEGNLKEFLHYLILFSTEALISCESYNIILGRLDQALPSVPRELEPVIRASMNELMQRAPEDCILGHVGCPVTSYNETRVCASVNSTELQHFLDAGNITNMLCHFSIGQYACSSLMPLGAENLVTLLKCKLPSNMMDSKETWKVFLTKVSGVLDEALSIFSNMTSHVTSLSTSHFLDILGELRIDEFSDIQLADVDLIDKWFHGNLRPFLSSVSGEFLRCLGTKNFSCETYQQVMKEFSFQFPHMEEMRQELVARYFIFPFLSQNTSDPACFISTNGSLDWLHKNFGAFSVILPLKDLLTFTQDFDPLEALPALSAKQMAELVASPESGPPQKDVIINTVFDHLLESPDKRTFMEFLHYLILFSTEALISCESYNTILGRLDQALPSVPRELEPVIRASMNELMQRAPEDCILGNNGCPVTSYNETRVCARVNSTELQHYLDTGNMTNMLCHFSIDQYACSSLMPLEAEKLVMLLKCKLPSNMMDSKETWKVFLTKVSGVLDEALSIFSNMTSHITSLSTSHFLDILGELRIDEFSDIQLADVDLIDKWFHGNLRPFLSSVSGEFLRCLGTKNFSCETYQQVVKEFSFQFPHMEEMRQKLVARYFIFPFLLRNTSDPACFISTNGSLDWLHKNFGAFSVILPLKDLLTFTQDFDPLEALPALSAKQMAELVASPESGPPQKDVIINTVFDHLLESSDKQTLMEFLHYLILFSTEALISCESYNTILGRLNQALPSVPRELEPVIRASMNELMQRAPEDCILGNNGCPVTSYNETRVCARVNSTELQHYLDTGNMTNMLCHFSIDQYACSSLMPLGAENLVTLLKCKLPSNMMDSKETWKVFLTKVSGVLDEALSIFSNMTSHITSLSTSHFLDILGELRIDEFSDIQLADVDLIDKWFHGNLRPFLSSVSGEFLRCLGTKNFSCETYQQVMKEFSFQFPHMEEMRQELVARYFIFPFLSRNTSDPACFISTNGSLDWLHKNFGAFSVILPLKDLLTFTQDFDPLETLPALSAKQMAELVASPESGPPQKDVIINTVFDHLLESPDKRTFMEFLHYLILFSTETEINCNSYKTIFSRLYQALPSVPQDIEPDVWASINELMLTAPEDCMPDVPGCSLTPHNETRVCADVDSSELQHYLDTGNKTEELCHFDIEQYACASLAHFTAENLVSLLKCKLPSNMTYSKESWKVFLIKASGVLNEALNIFSNMSFHITSPSTSQFLEILGEIRIDRFSEVQLADADFINEWFNGYLRPFLSFVSGEFLHCLNTKNFTCETYQHVVKEFSFQFPNMTQMRQKLVSKYFILPFLSRNASDPACVSSTNGSVDWLHKNFGPFSVFVPLKTLLALNQDLSPLEALPVLSTKQMAELVVFPQTGPPQKDVIINTVFDHLLESPDKKTFKEFLHYLILFSTETIINCDSYKTIFRKLYQALPLGPQELEPDIWASINELMKTAPEDCMPDVTGCSVTPHNESRVCADISSTELQHYLDSGNKTEELCHFDIEQYACSSLLHFTAENLVKLLKCKLPSNMTYSKETWKVFLTKASGVLNEALNIFSNMSFHITSPSTSHFLEILGEIRIDRFSEVQLADADFINEWFNGYLRPFLSSVSGEFLHCLNTKNFSCETYQQVMKEFTFQFPRMEQMKQELVSENFILPLLSRNTSDPGCVSSTNGSVDWLRKNFGPFSLLVPLKTLLALNQDLSPLEALPVLSTKQIAELVVFPQTGPSQKDVIINTVFDHLLESPDKRTFKEFLHYLILFSTETIINCDSYKTIFSKLYQALPLGPQELEPDIWASINELMKTAPEDCMPDVTGCSVTPHNETRVCADISSSELQHYLDSGNKTEELCHFDIEQYACSSLIHFTAENLVSLLKCKLPSNMTYSKETWKVFLTKASGVLNEALNIFSNMSFHITSPSTSHFLEILGEIRIDRFSEVQLADADFISKWFHGYLRPFLSSVSGEFLHCLNTKNFSCETYQQVMKEFTFQFPRMEQMKQELVSENFILPLLSRNTSDPGCVSSTNGSVDWLRKNFGPFSLLVPLKTLLALNQDLSPLEALPVLSTKQIAELVVFPLTGPPQKDVIISTVFDHLQESPDKRTFKEFLHYLILFSTETIINCDSYKTIFSKLYQALPLGPQELEPDIWASINELMKTAPEDCIPDVTGCSVTPHNETRVCADISSSELQHYLDSGNKTEELCHFDIEQYACSSLIHFTAENLVKLLKCKLPSNMTYSKETWKVFLTKASGVLNEALNIFSNMSFHITSPSTSHFLEILGEIRIDRFSEVQLADAEFINKWFHGYLRPFLSSVSGEFLHCLNTKNFSCETYQQVMKEFTFQFPRMEQMKQELVSENFILPLLSRTTSDRACVSSTNGSVDWLHKNFGPFSVLVPLKTLLTLNQEFAPLEALPILSARQAAELVVFPETGPAQKVIINAVFDHLLESPTKRNLNEFLQYLVMFSATANISCDSYKAIFNQLNQALSLVPVELVLTITSSTEALLGIVPHNCLAVVFSGECDITPVNETVSCAGVNSSVLQRNIRDGSITEVLCSFSIEQYACVSPIGLTAQHLVTLLQCKLKSNVTSSKETWKLFLTKVSGILDEALDLFSNMMASSSNPSTSHVLEVIGEIRIDSFSAAELRDLDFIDQWFQMKLKPFLPSVSREFLSCLSTKNFSCQTYQAVVKILGQHYAEMDRYQKILIYTEFIDIFLSQNDTSDPGCISGTHGSADWLERNFGRFIDFASVMDFRRLHMGFSPMDALSRLSLNQLSEVASTPGQLNSPGDVTELMGHVKAIDLATFFDIVSPAIQGHENVFPTSVRSAMLQQVFDRGNLSSVSDAEILAWLQNRLRPLLANLSLNHVAPFFTIVKERQCVTSQHAVQLLNSIRSTLHSDTQREVYSHILTSLKEPVPLRCYTNGSFYLFLERSFLSFEFPNLTTFISLMPEGQRSELINSIPPSDLTAFFMRPKVVDNSEGICTIFNNYDSTPNFLETQGDIPDNVRRSILPCVWPLALSSENETEVDLWFEKRLKLYLTFLTKDLISSTETLNAKCLPFRKIVFALGDSYKYNNADFTREDVYGTIKTYLNTGTKPKCYNATHPQLNSKAWFANYIGRFIAYITLDDLNTFCTTEQLQVFSTNLANVELFNHSSIPENVTSYYTELIYLEDSNFNPLLLPMHFRCGAPGSAFSQLNADESMIILHNLTQSCSEVDPEVSTALAGNFQTINSDIITALGKESVGLTPGQISAVPPSDIVSSLPTLSTVTDWNLGQSITIVKKLLKANFAIITGFQLQQLGSLVMGVPSNVIQNIDSTEILLTSQNPGFITNILAAPQIIQRTYVSKIISVSSTPAKLLENVPDTMGTEIPRTLLEFSPESFEKVNLKKWKYEQAVLFFDVVATGFTESNRMSTAVLQGFTCTRVQKFSRIKVRNLIRACRRSGVNRVVLRETQLTCMYNYIKDFDTDSFQQYPPDMLLYYNYNTVQGKCKAYFTETGAADYSVLSDALKAKKDALLDNAKSCLGIRGTSINRTNVEILGNMCCTLDGSYIENSDPLILEKLKNCKDLSEVQISSVQKVLLTGNTQYGHPSTWDVQTLKDLGILPLYMKTDFWSQFNRRVKKRFLKYFMKAQRRDRREKRKLKRMFRECNRSLRSKRAAASDCTAGSITQVVISDDAFPFGYDASQFNACLSVSTVKDNLAGLTMKVDDDDFQRIILDKLNQAYPKGIADEQVQGLGAVSRVASIDDINNWNVTNIDTLDALMVSDDGQWEPDKSKAIITKYLSTAGNSLGTAELNAIGGANLCSLDTNVLEGITPSSLRNANALSLSNCSTEKQKALFIIANQAYSNRNTISLTEYQLIEQFLGGAPEAYIRRLTASNVSMDISTFTSLDENVINALTVNDVKLLLGVNLPDLKNFENQTVVANWISNQFKSELNSLGLDIIGGRDDPVPTGVGVINTTTTATGGSTSTSTTTTSGHDGSTKKPSHVLYLLLALAFTTLQTLP